MIFETLYESSRRGELLLINGGLCHWHLRKDGQITIREIISTRPGAGKEMLSILIDIAYKKKALSLFAKCPTDLPANDWYKKNGFANEGMEITKTGRQLTRWRHPL